MRREQRHDQHHDVAGRAWGSGARRRAAARSRARLCTGPASPSAAPTATSARTRERSELDAAPRRRRRPPQEGEGGEQPRDDADVVAGHLPVVEDARGSARACCCRRGRGRGASARSAGWARRRRTRTRTRCRGCAATRAGARATARSGPRRGVSPRSAGAAEGDEVEARRRPRVPGGRVAPRRRRGGPPRRPATGSAASTSSDRPPARIESAPKSASQRSACGRRRLEPAVDGPQDPRDPGRHLDEDDVADPHHHEARQGVGQRADERRGAAEAPLAQEGEQAEGREDGVQRHRVAEAARRADEVVDDVGRVVDAVVRVDHRGPAAPRARLPQRQRAVARGRGAWPRGRGSSCRRRRRSGRRGRRGPRRRTGPRPAPRSRRAPRRRRGAALSGGLGLRARRGGPRRLTPAAR